MLGYRSNRGGTAVTERVSVTAVMNSVGSFFFIITAPCAAVPLHRRILDMKHVASWVLGLFERHFHHRGSLCWEAVPQVHLQKRLHETLCPYAPTYLTVQRSRLKMIPLMPTVALALFSVICSAFVILRILLSTLPQPRLLGRRVYPVRFFLTAFSDIPPATDIYQVDF